MIGAPARERIKAVAGVVAVLYVALVCLATGCVFAHAGMPGGHDHHAPDPGHSSLCVWSCQATSNVGLLSDPPAVAAEAAERLAPPSASLPVAPRTAELSRGRAPPLPASA